MNTCLLSHILVHLLTKFLIKPNLFELLLFYKFNDNNNCKRNSQFDKQNRLIFDYILVVKRICNPIKTHRRYYLDVNILIWSNAILQPIQLQVNYLFLVMFLSVNSQFTIYIFQKKNNHNGFLSHLLQTLHVCNAK